MAIIAFSRGLGLMHTDTFLVTAAAAALLAGSVRAQTFRLLPAYADAVDGHRDTALPFGRPGFRTQILVDGPRLAANAALLNGISFRADRVRSPMPAVLVPNVTVTISHTSVTIGALATTFANNVTSPATVVFQGTVSLPAQGVGFAGPLSWNIAIPFSQQYAYTTALGNLLIDIVGNNPAGPETYYLDAVQPGGTATEFGALGSTPSVGTLWLKMSTGNQQLEPRLLSPGHAIQFTSYLFWSTSPGVAAPGVVGLGTAAQPVPFHLGPLGAPSNFLYIDTLLCPPHVWVPWMFGVSSTHSLAVPNGPALVGATVYGQSAIFVAAANPLGIVTSNAVEVRIGDEFEVPAIQQLNAPSPISPTGVLLDFGTLVVQPQFGAAAIRFDGWFF